MPLFGFGDIKFNKGILDRRGPLGALVGDPFKTTTLRYPIDIGNADKGHYMVFYIREQKNTGFGGDRVGEDALSKASKGIQEANAAILSKLNTITPSAVGSKVGGELLSKINNGLDKINNATGGSLTGLTSAIGKVAGGTASSIDSLFGTKTNLLGGNSVATQAKIDTSIKSIADNSVFPRTTFLTKDSIALYMPDTLSYQYTQSYDTPSLGDSLLGQAAAVGGDVFTKLKEGKISEAMGAVSKATGGTLVKRGADKLGAAGTLAFTAVTGAVSNPLLEMIYKSPNFRSFQFDFTFYPRDEREAFEVQEIIERFRFHQAPEIADAKNFLIPPSEFEIKFYYGGAENPNIPPITICVLESIDVNYAPNGFSAYEVPGENSPALGRTGMPVSIQMTLQFKETTYLTKSDFKSGRKENKKPLFQTDTISGSITQAGDNLPY